MRYRVLMAALTVACAGSASAKGLDGHWFGGRIGSSTEVLDLKQHGTNITGTGHINFEAMCTADVTIDGTITKAPPGAERLVTFTLTSTNPQGNACDRLTFKGTLSGDTLSGGETGVGGATSQWVFTRQTVQPPPTGVGGSGRQ